MGLSNMFDAVGDAVGDVATELTSFTKFRQRVDELIRDLKGSPAGAQRVGQEQLTRHQFGGGNGAWADAAGLFDSYQSVIKELESLSQLLSDSMEGMSIAVLASHQGYQNIDVDIRDRMAKIYAETAKHYGEHPGHRPYGDDPYSKYDGGGAQAPGGDRGTDGSQEQGAGGDSGGRGGQAYPPGKAQPPAGDTGRGGDAGGAI